MYRKRKIVSIYKMSNNLDASSFHMKKKNLSMHIEEAHKSKMKKRKKHWHTHTHTKSKQNLICFNFVGFVGAQFVLFWSKSQQQQQQQKLQLILQS